MPTLVATSQAWQVPVQVVSQQTPSTQLLDSHSAFVAQLVPFVAAPSRYVLLGALPFTARICVPACATHVALPAPPGKLTAENTSAEGS